MIRDILLNLLYNLGGKREVERYLAQYTKAAPGRSTVVKVGGALIEDDLDDLASSLAFLGHVGMLPVVVHGGGPQLSRALDEQGIESRWVDGFRVTTSQVLGVAHRMFLREGARLAQAIDGHGVRARVISSGVFTVEPDDFDRLGYVGRVVEVNLSPVRDAFEAGYIPVLSPLGVTPDGQLLNVNADTASRALAQALRPGKVVFLTGTGGILGLDGSVISAVNLEEDQERLISTGEVSGGMARKLIEIGELLSSLPEHATVSITKPSHLARELFTHQGSGTLIRRGASIQSVDRVDALDQTELKSLLEASFGRVLCDGYLDSVADAQALIAPYTAVAIVETHEGFSYLDKFAVTAQAQGAGIGATLWNKLIEAHPKLVWRSRAENPVNGWYLQRADGMKRDGQWVVYWRGLESNELIDQAIGHALGVEPSFSAQREQPEVHCGA